MNAHFQRFKPVFFIDASSDSSIKADLRNAIQCIEGHQQDTEQDALYFLSAHLESLLIFDNADDPNVNLTRSFPNSYKGTVVITSRLRSLGELSTLHHLHLGEMSRDEALETLVKAARRTPPLRSQDTQVLHVLIEELGYLALALVQAGVYIFNSGSIEGESTRESVFGQYLELFRKERASLMRRQGAQSLDNYTRGVYPTLDLSYTLLPGFARELLHLCSLFHYTNISLAMLLAAAGKNFEDSHKYLKRPESHREVQSRLRALFLPRETLDEVHIRETIRSLSSFSLVQTTLVNETILLRFHPLVHSWSYEILSSDSVSLYTRMAITTISTSEASLSRSHIQYLPPHIIAVMRKINLSDLHVRDMIKLGVVMGDNGFVRVGLELHEGAVEKMKKEVGSHDNQMIEGYIWLANAYGRGGRYQEAEKLEVRILSMQCEILGERHPDTIMASNNLALTYRDLGKLKEAEELLVNVFAMWREVLGERHPHTINASNNLAITYCDLGKLKEAEELQVNVLAMRREVLGDRHPHTINASSNLAVTYRDLDKLKEAEELQVNVLTMRREVLGERHPDTIMASNNLAITYRNFGKLKEAQELQVNVLAIRREVLGERHPHTIWASDNLAITYRDLSRLQEAEELQTKVLAISREVIGENHPEVIKVFNHLAITYQRLGKLNQAEELCKKAQELAFALLGENHPTSIWIARTLNKIQADIQQACQEPARKRRRRK
jgi:tetratricopeptide (TPR) repeat protein